MDSKEFFERTMIAVVGGLLARGFGESSMDYVLETAQKYAKALKEIRDKEYPPSYVKPPIKPYLVND